MGYLCEKHISVDIPKALFTILLKKKTSYHGKSQSDIKQFFSV